MKKIVSVLCKTSLYVKYNYVFVLNYCSVLMFYNSYSVCCATSTCFILVQFVKYIICVMRLRVHNMLVNVNAICTCV